MKRNSRLLPALPSPCPNLSDDDPAPHKRQLILLEVSKTKMKPSLLLEELDLGYVVVHTKIIVNRHYVVFVKLHLLTLTPLRKPSSEPLLQKDAVSSHSIRGRRHKLSGLKWQDLR